MAPIKNPKLGPARLALTLALAGSIASIDAHLGPLDEASRAVLTADIGEVLARHLATTVVRDIAGIDLRATS